MQIPQGVHLHGRTGAPADFVSRKRLADCAEIWCVVRGQLARRFTQVRGDGTSARVHVRTRFPYLWNGLVDYAEIWFS